MAPTLGYWNLRGRAESIRLVLAYSGIEFEDKRYTNYEQWFEEKKSSPFAFPNLPYFISGDLKITQSIAILRHVARKANLVADNEADQARLEMLEQQAEDLKMALVKVVYSGPDKFEQLKVDYLKELPDKLKQWSDYLADKKYLLGDKITYVDFLLADVLQVHQMFVEKYGSGPIPSSLDSYVKRIESLPGVKEYIAGPTYTRETYFGPMAAIFAAPKPK